jgi:VanZ family protein
MKSSDLALNPWRERTSPLARAAWVVYALLLAYSGLAPWTGWRDLGLQPFAYLAAPIPRHITTFDLVVNVLAYMPFGALLVLALHPRVKGYAAVLVALLGGVLLAGAIEALQTYLPARISSNVDLATNVAGALLGGVLAAPLAAGLIDRGRLADWRLRWFDRNSSTLLLLVVLWPVAQIYPEPMLFGNGEVRGALGDFVEALGGTWPTLDAALFGPAEFVLAEAFVVASAVLAVGLAFATAMRPPAPRSVLLVALLVAGLLTKMLAHGVQFGAERAFAWLTPGAYGGLAIGTLSLLAASAGPRPWLPRFALLALIALIACVNIVPDNPYYTAAMQEWRQGAMLNFNALARWLSIFWPYAVALWLLLESARIGESRRAAL